MGDLCLRLERGSQLEEAGILFVVTYPRHPTLTNSHSPRSNFDALIVTQLNSALTSITVAHAGTDNLRPEPGLSGLIQYRFDSDLLSALEPPFSPTSTPVKPPVATKSLEK